MFRRLEKAFTLIEILIVVVIVWILLSAFSKITNNYSVIKQQWNIMAEFLNLKYSIWNFPVDISPEFIDLTYKFKPINSVIVKFTKDWISDYKYITKDDYKKYSYNLDNNFLGFNKLWDNNLFYDNYLWVKKYITKLNDWWDISDCTIYSRENNSWSVITKEFNLENWDIINLLITKFNVFLLNDMSKQIDWQNNYKIKKMFCNFIDNHGNMRKFIILLY